jgi:hypothetical protein
MDNPFSPKDSLSTLLSLISDTSSKPTTNYGSTLAALSAGSSLDTTNALLPTSQLSFGALSALYVPPSPPKLPVVPLSTITNALTAPAVQRMAYFAFDFDDVIRVNNVRQTGKIGPRVVPRSRGFLDRSVWESKNINTAKGLKELMQQASKSSSVVCVLVGTNTWFSRWVRYEIALSVINERGLMAIDLNRINHHQRQAPDPLGVSPLNFMGVRKDESGSWHLVERMPVELGNGEVGFEWHLYLDYQPPVPRPRYVPESLAGTIIPLSLYTRRYNFVADIGSKNIGFWLDQAAIAVNR